MEDPNTWGSVALSLTNLGWRIVLLPSDAWSLKSLRYWIPSSRSSHSMLVSALNCWFCDFLISCRLDELAQRKTKNSTVHAMSLFLLFLSCFLCFQLDVTIVLSTNHIHTWETSSVVSEYPCDYDLSLSLSDGRRNDESEPSSIFGCGIVRGCTVLCVIGMYGHRWDTHKQRCFLWFQAECSCCRRRRSSVYVHWSINIHQSSAWRL